MAVLSTLLIGVSGCVGLPVSGPVQAGPPVQPAAEEAPFDFSPSGPRPGASRASIVNGFLTAMEATPLSTFVAREFLTTSSAASWHPQDSTFIYRSHTIEPTGHAVDVRLVHVVKLDRTGAWLGQPPARQQGPIRFKLVKQKGEWRISNPPDALIVSRDHFATHYAQYFLYFFDPSGQVLVPEPVYLPAGPQAPTLLVADLLKGPAPSLAKVERSFIPSRTALSDISVPVDKHGVAQVPLSAPMLSLGDQTLNKAFAQLAWTLQQEPGIERMRVTVNGTALSPSGQHANVDVTGWSEFAPAVAWASQSLFGIRDGRVVEVAGGRLTRVTGVFGSLDLGIRSIGVDLAARYIAAVNAHGTSVAVAPVSRTTVTPPTPAQAHTVLSGATDLLRPVYDLFDRLWLVDRSRSGARVYVVSHQSPTVVRVPGISGRDVRSFVLSRDGTRLVADIGDDRLVVVRVKRTESGQVVGFTRPVRIPLRLTSTESIRDLAWRTAGTLAVLVRSANSAQVLIMKVDGSSTAAERSADAEELPGRGTRVVSSPQDGAPLYVATQSGRLYQLTETGRWIGVGLGGGPLASLTFVG